MALFKHKSKAGPADQAPADPTDQKSIGAPVESAAEKKPSIEELLEKNLKWSQIIYEQNRRINRKLAWAAVASWLRLFVIAIPLLLALWYLPPLMRNFWDTYGQMLNGFSNASSKTNSSPASLEQLLQFLPLDSAQQQQLKALLR